MTILYQLDILLTSLLYSLLGKNWRKGTQKKKNVQRKMLEISPPPQKKKKKIPGFILFDHNALRFQDETAIVENVHLRQITRSIIFTRP